MENVATTSFWSKSGQKLELATAERKVNWRVEKREREASTCTASQLKADKNEELPLQVK